MTNNWLLGFRLYDISGDELLKRIQVFIRNGTPHSIVLLNPHMLLVARKSQDLVNYINSSNVVVADGVGIILAARFLGLHIRERIIGTDLMPKLCELCNINGYKIYFFGAAPGVASKAAQILGDRYHGLKIVGLRDGYFNASQEREIVEEIKSKKPDILIVCLGVPKQELWINKYKDTLNVPVTFGNGAAFDFVAGKFKRAPKWMQKLGVEWVFRLIQEPHRLWRRYLVGNIVFIFLVLKQKVLQRY